jgi:hypothetical protein
MLQQYFGREAPTEYPDRQETECRSSLLSVEMLPVWYYCTNESIK